MTTRLIQDLHAGISRRDWSAVETAANALRDESDKVRRALAATDFGSLPADYPTLRMVEDRMEQLSRCCSAPETNTTGDDAAWNSLLAAQNNVIDGPMSENELLFKALGQLELANDNVCGARPQKVYDAMIAAGMSDRMTELDEARRIARATLADAGRARLATTEGQP